MGDVKIPDGRKVYCTRNYSGWKLPDEDCVPERFRGKEVVVRYGSITGHDDGFLIIESKGAETLVLEGDEIGEWSEKDKKLVDLVASIVPKGL